MGSLIEVSRRGFLVGSLAFVGCRGRGGPSSSTGPSPSPKTAPLGYSHVLRLTGARAQAVADVGGRLVMAETTNSSPLSDIAVAAEVMQRVSGQLLLVGLNWNDVEGRAQVLSWYQEHVTALIETVGVSNVLFEPIAEPWVASQEKAAEWFDDGARRWRAAGGTVVGPLEHPCSLDRARAMVSAKQLTVMDCGPVLASTLSESEIRDLARVAIDLGTPLLFYDTGGAAWNETVVRWIGDEVAR